MMLRYFVLKTKIARCGLKNCGGAGWTMWMPRGVGSGHRR